MIVQVENAVIDTNLGPSHVRANESTSPSRPAGLSLAHFSESSNIEQSSLRFLSMDVTTGAPHILSSYRRVVPSLQMAFQFGQQTSE